MNNGAVVLEQKKGLEKEIEKQIIDFRSNLLGLEKECSSILFTSTYSGEGKSTLSLNLAISLSKCGKKVVWIDCNPHKEGALYSLSQTTNEHKTFWGMLSYLNGSCSLSDIIYPVKGEEIFAIPLGKEKGAACEYLERETLDQLMKKLKQEYDYIIVDTSAASKYAESKILASRCDGVVFVIEYNKVKQKKVDDVVAQIRKCGGKILGAVLNKSKL